jgi:hypothetical protein
MILMEQHVVQITEGYVGGLKVYFQDDRNDKNCPVDSWNQLSRVERG